MTLKEYAAVLPPDTVIHYELPNNFSGLVKAKNVFVSDMANQQIDIIVDNVVRLKPLKYDLLIEGDMTIYDKTKLYSKNDMSVKEVLDTISNMFKVNAKYSTIHIDIVKRY